MSRRVRLLALLSALILVAAACGGGDDGGEGGTEAAGGGGEGGEGGGPITFWSTEDLEDRVAIQREIVSAFTEETGIEVELTPVAEDELPNLMIANAASGDLPDVVFHGLDFAAGWAEEGLIDPEAANAVVEELGRDTFSGPALDLATVDDQVVSVPADGWGQLLVYRTDLFEEAGLEPPDTFENILAAAEELHDPDNDMSAITLATDPADVFTQQTFEALALANGCQMVDDAGEVTLGSPECAEAIEFYATLVNDYSPGGAQTVDTTRATYFAGQAAMIVWSPFILDEMAGLRDDALPTCPECEEDPAFLAKNSGLIGAISGGGSEPAQYGQVSYFGIGAEADVPAAQEFIRYLLNDGYVDWLSMAPEGKFPMRLGTADDPEAFVTQWQDLEAGVDRKAPLSENYGQEVVDRLQEGVSAFTRWGVGQGAGAEASQLYETLAVPQALNEVIQGGLTPQEAAEQIASEIE
jgi:multiple sugar transport system substrate-binding protein